MGLWIEMCNFKHNMGIAILSIQVNITQGLMPMNLTDG